MERNQPKSVKLKKKERKTRSGVNCKGTKIKKAYKALVSTCRCHVDCYEYINTARRNKPGVFRMTVVSLIPKIK
jgi:hypothetical protein